MGYTPVFKCKNNDFHVHKLFENVSTLMEKVHSKVCKKILKWQSLR